MKTKHLNLALADQVIVSGGNFFVGLMLGRFLDSSEFGLYIFGFTSLIFALGFVSNATFSALSVLGASVEEQLWPRVVHSALFIFLICCGGIILLFLLATVILQHVGYASNSAMLVAATFVVFPSLLQEFIRRALFTRMRSFQALLLDCFTYGPRVIILYLVYHSAHRDIVSARFAIYLIGLTSLLGILIGCLSTRFLYLRGGFRIDRLVLLRMREYSKWMIAEWFPFLIAGSLYIYVVAFALGNEQNGILGACRNLVQPVTILLLSITNIALPFYSALLARDSSRNVIRHMSKFFVIILCIILLYFVIINLFSTSILMLVFRKYSEHGQEVFLFSVANFVIFLFKPGEIYLKASFRPQLVFKSRVISAVVSVATIVVLINFFGLYGALYSYILTEIAMCLAIYYYLFKSGSSSLDTPEQDNRYSINLKCNLVGATQSKGSGAR